MTFLLTLLAVQFSATTAVLDIELTEPESLLGTRIAGKVGMLGLVPYGSYVAGNLVKVPSRLCRPYDVSLDPTESYIFLVERGDCEFQKKALHSENALAKAVLFYDNVQEDLFLLAGDPGKVHIPTVWISRDDGLMLMEQTANVKLNLTFHGNKNTSPSFEIVLTGDHSIDSTLAEIFAGLEDFAESLTLVPYYRINKCVDCYSFAQPVKQCLGGGRYCAPPSSHAGTAYLFEVLRQDCVFRTASRRAYIQYMKAWTRECNFPYFQECEPAFQRAQLNSSAISQCISESFNHKYSLVAENSVLKSAQANYSALKPTARLYISGSPFEGEIWAATVQRAACSLLLAPPPACWETQCAQSCWPELHANGYCDTVCNVSACGFDEGDCREPRPVDTAPACSPGCTQELVSDSACSLVCNTSACLHDSGNCLSEDIYIPEKGYPTLVFVLALYFPRSFVSFIVFFAIRVARLKISHHSEWATLGEAQTERKLDSVPFTAALVEFGSPDCAICITPCVLRRLEESVPVFKTECKHVFHSACLQEWFQYNPGCPVCMQVQRP